MLSLYIPSTPITDVKAKRVNETDPKILCSFAPAPKREANAVKSSIQTTIAANLASAIIPF